MPKRGSSMTRLCGTLSGLEYDFAQAQLTVAVRPRGSPKRSMIVIRSARAWWGWKWSHCMFSTGTRLAAATSRM